MSERKNNLSVRNPDGIWINTSLFSTEAKYFKKYGYYCPDPWGSPAWEDYWREQLDYCINGYSVGGVKILGHHYYYLNFKEILLVEYGTTGKVTKKIKDFPYFWDGDYNYFWAKEIARNGITPKELKKLNLHLTIPEKYLDGGYHFLVAKARRKGYSYKNAAVVENTYNTIPNSLCLIGAFDKKYLYPEGTMGMVSKGLDFLNQYTGWAKGREFLNRVDHKRASYSQTDARGFTYETGYMSQVMALTFKDNPDAARGKDAVEVLLEEAGKFSNLQASFMATDDTLRAGKYLTGQMTIFGTSGDIEGDSLDLANMFYNPEPFRILPFVNIWDDNAENSLCCFFHPVHWNMEGCMDEHGNSDLEAALNLEMEHRDLMVKTAKSSVMLQQRQMENPTKPSEAFMNVSVNNFPVAELKEQLAKVKAQSLHTKTGVAGYFMYDNDGKLRFKPDLTASLQPLWDYPPKSKDLAGCVVVYEDYRVSEPGTYKIGYDPYRQNVSEYSDSVGSVYVYKTIIQGDPIRNIIAAEYVGRPQDMDTFNRNVEMLAEYYHAEVMYENEVTAVKTYFEKRKKLKYLAAQPDNLISTIIKDSRVNRIYGMHMTDKIKEAGEKYTNSWLLEERGINEKGNVIRNLNMINSKGLLEELILYNRKGNFDRIMAWFMVMFQLEADSINPPEQRQQRMESIREDLENLTKNLYRR